MSFKRKARRAVFAESVKQNLPPSYWADANALFEAAIEYLQAHPGQVLIFDLPPKVLDRTFLPLGNLSELQRFACDGESAEFIRWLDERTGFKCTVFQFRHFVVPLLNELKQGAKA